MQLWAGTSGYSYDEWKGSFYPEDLPARKRLEFYATRLPAVEINNTFYRLPKRSLLESWAAQVPPGFRFVLKASQKITHRKRLKDAGEETTYLLDTAGVLGDRLGAVLFQLPPYLRKDTDRLARFLDELPETCRAAFEFRHESWLDEEILDLLRQRNAALCIADVEERPTAIRPTADWGYLRLRRGDYTKSELRSWLKKIRAQPWNEAFVFFKHEDEGIGPRLAGQMLGIADASS